MKNLYCGIDFHKNKSVVCIKDEQGNEVKLLELLSDNLIRFLSDWSKMVVGVEASGGVNHLVSEIKKLGHEVKIINPVKFRAVGIGGKKTDKKDARVLAECLRLNFIPEVHHKTLFCRELKTMLVSREMLVRSRVNMTNHIRGTLREYGIKMAKTAEVFFREAASCIDQIPNPYIKSSLLDLLERSKSLKEQELVLTGLIEQSISTNPRTEQLMSVPGVGLITTAAMIAVSDEISRFKDSKHFASYLGLVPREHSSGEMRRMGSITRSGSELLRRYLIHGARAVLRYPARGNVIDPNKLWALKIKKRAGFNKAVVALAHRLSRICFSMLKTGEVYRKEVVTNTEMEIEDAEQLKIAA